MSPTPRSYLYVPGDRADVLAKATSRGADAIIIDLEDAVAASAKERARADVAAYLESAVTGDVELWVRVNGGALAAEDIAAVVSPALAGIVLAKAESPEEVRAADAAIAAAESRRGLPAGSIGLVPLLESAGAVLSAVAIATASPRVQRVQAGEADLRAELGITLGDDERELLMIRSHVVLASSAAGIEPPVAPVSTDFRDLGRLRATSEELLRMGFRGRACIHPAQCAVVNEVFTPSAADIAAARELVARYDEAIAAGQGAFTGADGRMVDIAVVKVAQRLLRYAR